MQSIYPAVSLGENKLLATRDKEGISSGSIQSPHDPDSHYRNKDGNHVKGYSINVTESYDRDELHLITDIDVRPVSAADNYFLQDGIKQSQQALSGKIKMYMRMALFTVLKTNDIAATKR